MCNSHIVNEKAITFRVSVVLFWDSREHKVSDIHYILVIKILIIVNLNEAVNCYIILIKFRKIKTICKKILFENVYFFVLQTKLLVC